MIVFGENIVHVRENTNGSSQKEGGEIYGYEFKWNPKKKIRLPKTFVEKYNAKEKIINRDNFREFVKISSNLTTSSARHDA